MIVLRFDVVCKIGFVDILILHTNYGDQIL